MLKTAKILGAIVFIIQAFLFMLYWTWPFGSSADRNYYPFATLVICLIGYLLALRWNLHGGIMLIVGSILFAVTPLFSETNESLLNVLIIMTLISLPPLTVGGLFIAGRKAQ